MFERKIVLHEAEDVKEFVAAAGKCDFDIDIFYNRITIDGKSILGILSMDLRNVLTVKYPLKNQEFETVLDRFTAA